MGTARGEQSAARPRLVREPLEWNADARCRTADPELFFHPIGERGSDHDARDRNAKAVCAGCPVRVQCGEWALERREPYGVWGGMTEDERRKILHRAARARLGVAA